MENTSMRTSVFRMEPYKLPSQISTEQIYQTLLKCIRLNDYERLQEILSKIPESEAKLTALHGVDRDGETLLHTAVKLRRSPEVVACLVEDCPELLTACRENSNPYRGQTALHIAVTDGNIELVDLLLDMACAFDETVVTELLQKCATGSRFENTVMMGEVPLTVAALTLNTKMIDLIQSKGADLNLCNSDGDNIIHCLIKYAFLYPEKVDNILTVCAHISSSINKNTSATSHLFDANANCEYDNVKLKYDVWFARNNSRLSPLQLSAKLGQQQIFKLIIEMRNVYSFVNSEDGLFDVELFDVTEIEPAPEQEHLKSARNGKVSDGVISTSESYTDNVSRVPTLELIFNNAPEIVFKFIEMTPLRFAINRKWTYYRWFYSVWSLVHMLFMVGFTVYAVRRSELDIEITGGKITYTKRYAIGQDGYETFYVILSLIFAAIYMGQEIARIVKRQMPWSKDHLMNCYHNGPFRLMLLLFSLTVLFDSVWAIIDRDSRDYLLVCAMILGWWFLVFFLRCVRQFSFFTVMIQKVLVGDMFRFSIIISMELIAFTSGLFIAFRGSFTGDDNVYSYSRLMVLMFKMMFGFTSIDVLFEAREPWFAVCIFVAFVILTYVLMVNSLIAMMSNTCSVVSKNREIQYRVQQLSTILFFESVFPTWGKKMIGSPRLCNWHDPSTRQFSQRIRYFMEIKSLHEVTKSKSRHLPKPETMLETIFHTIQQLPNVFGHSEAPVDSSPDDARREPHSEVATEYARPAPTRRHKKKKKKRHGDLSTDGTGEAHA